MPNIKLMRAPMATVDSAGTGALVLANCWSQAPLPLQAATVTGLRSVSGQLVPGLAEECN